MGRKRCRNSSVRQEQVKRKSLLTSLADLLVFPCCRSSTTDHVPRDKRLCTRPGPVSPSEAEDSLSLSVEIDSLSDGDDISVIDLGEETASAESAFVRVERHDAEQSGLDLPDGLSSIASNKIVLPPLQPLLQSKGIADMQNALKKAEAEESADIPSGFLKASSKKQQYCEKKLIAKLAEKDAKRERQEIKNKLARKKKLVKRELQKIEHSKKRAEMEEALQMEWDKVDKVTEGERAEAATQQNNSKIETLEREVELLKKKQECKVVEQRLLSSKGHKGSIISKAVRQCKSLRIKQKHSALERKISDILNEVDSLKEQAKQPELQAVTTTALESAEKSIEQCPHEQELANKQKSKDIDLLALFVGDSFKDLVESSTQAQEKKCLLKFRQKCEDQEQTTTAPAVEESKDKDLGENESEYSFKFEEDIDDDVSSEIERVCGSPNPQLYRCTRLQLVPLHKLLPKPLEVIEEETDEDMEAYERGEYVCSVKFYQSCREGDIDDFTFEDFYSVH